LQARRDLLLIIAAGFLRSLGIGLIGVVLGVYLYRVGFSSLNIGLVIASGLFGGALATVGVTFWADRIGRRRALVILSVLSAGVGFALASTSDLYILLVAGFLGGVNATGSDRTAMYAMDQAVIPGLVSHRGRTWALSWYNMALDGGGAIGALAAGLPLFLARSRGGDVIAAYHRVFYGYAVVSLLSASLYFLMSRKVEVGGAETPMGLAAPVSAASKRIVFRLAALFSMDALGGGFLTDALVAYWFFRRFDTSEQALGVLFFAVHALNAVSHLIAAWLSRRIGLLNTMILTHLPSSIFLIAVPFAPSLRAAIVLFLLRESLVEMDVPTRQSYIAAVVQPHERTFASGVTNLARNLWWALASSVAGLLMQRVSFSAPLLLGGSLKIGYDILLYRAFRSVKPPEELPAKAKE
jgi:MFS family permease